MKARTIALLLLTACGQTGGEPVGSITTAPAGGASSGGSGDGGGGQGGSGGAAGISGGSGQAGAGASSGGSGQSGAAGGPPCPAPTPPSGGKCTQVGYPFLCDLFTGGGCNAGSACLFDSQDVEFECFLIPPESLASLACGACDVGDLGEPCAPGYHCHEGRCSRYCCDDGDCEQGACVPDTWLPAPLGVCAPKP